jgi:hypothetical protein
MTECRSEPKLSLFGRIPPRTPGRSDAQVPRDAALGPAQYARISHVYFYAANNDSDPHYGLLDIEIALQRRQNGEIWFEAYCTGDGYQTSRGAGTDHPLHFELRSGSRVVATVPWHYPTVLCGHFDPMTFATKTGLSSAEFGSIDQVYLPEVVAEAKSCLGAPSTFGGPDGH